MRSLLELYKILLYEMIFSKTKFGNIGSVKLSLDCAGIINDEENILLEKDYYNRKLYNNSNLPKDDYGSRINMIYNVVKELRNEKTI